MKKLVKFTALMLAVAFLFAAADAFAADKAKFHIGVATGTVSQSEDDLRGAEALIKKYGSVKDGGMILGEDNQKMSKSRGNVVNPDDIVRDFGADSMGTSVIFI